MTDKALQISIGSLLQLQAAAQDNAPRYQVKVIGYLVGGSLVVTTPVLQHKVQIIREGIPCTVRMLSGSEVVGFSSRVLSSSVKPYPHLHLEYPKAIESISVRNANRVSVQLDGQASNLDMEDVPADLPIRINDLSYTGCGFLSELIIGRPGNRVRLAFQLSILGTTEMVIVGGVVRRINEKIRKDGRRLYNHGMEFTQVNRIQQVTIHAWVLENLLSTMG